MSSTNAIRNPYALSSAALACVEETGTVPALDVNAIREGRQSAESLLVACLDGADEDREEGWRDYVSAVALAAGVQS